MTAAAGELPLFEDSGHDELTAELDALDEWLRARALVVGPDQALAEQLALFRQGALDPTLFEPLARRREVRFDAFKAMCATWAQGAKPGQGSLFGGAHGS